MIFNKNVTIKYISFVEIIRSKGILYIIITTTTLLRIYYFLYS